MTVNSDGANAFSFSGNGKITGTGSLTKSGTSTLTISTANDYTGGTTINAGTVIASDTGPCSVQVPPWATASSRLPLGRCCKLAMARLVLGPITGSAITNDGSIIVNRPDSSTLNGAITGTGTLAVQGGGTLTRTGAASTYSGNTTVSGGSTLLPAAANIMSANSVINIDNTVGSRFTLNGFNQTIGGLSGGGANSGDVTIGTNGLTFAGIGTNNLNYAGPISSVSGTITMGTTQSVNDEGSPATARVVALSSKDAVQTLSGAAMNITGPTTVNVGTLNYAPSVPTTIGGTNRSISITAPITLPFGVGTSTPPNQPPPPIGQVTQATLTTNANTTLLVNNLTLNANQNSVSNFVENGGTVQVNGTVTLGSSNGGGIITLNGGTFIAAGGGTTNTIPASIVMGATGGFQQTGAPPLTRPYQFAAINVDAGATLNILGGIAMGTFFNTPCTVTQNGGDVTFVDGSLNPGGAGTWSSQNNNNANFGRYVWNLNGGVLSMNSAAYYITAGGGGSVLPDTGTLPNINPVLNLNGGTLRALSDQPTAMFDFRYRLVAQANGGTIDTNSHVINFTAPIIHDPAAGAPAIDGGVALVDNVGGGNLTYSVANTYTGPTKIGAGGKLILNLANAIPSTSAVNLAGGTLNTGGFDQNMSASTRLKVSGNSTLDLATGGSVQLCRQHAFALGHRHEADH